MTSNEELVNDIFEQVSDTIDVSREEIEEAVTDFSEYGLPSDEVYSSVIRRLADGRDVEAEDLRQSGGGDSDFVDVSEVSDMDEGQWVSLRVKYEDPWDLSHEGMAQQGLLGDETGVVKFTAWKSDDVQEIEEGKSYEIRNVVTDVYEGRTNVVFRSSTEIEEIDEDVEVSRGDNGGSEVEATGAFVAVQSGSGLINRCTADEDCTRVLQNGRCKEHGEVEEGEFDLRVKGVLDDGHTAHEFIMQRELTEEITGITLDEAREIAMEQLNKSAVADEISDRLVGRYFRVAGPKYDRYIFANEMEQVTDEPDVENLLIRGRSM